MRRVFRQRFWSTLLVAAISLVFWTVAFPNGTWEDGPNKQWLEGLQRPDNDQHPYRRSGSQIALLLWRGRYGADEIQGREFQRPVSRGYLVRVVERLLGPGSRRKRSFRITRRMDSPISSCWPERCSVSCGRRAASEGSSQRPQPSRLSMPPAETLLVSATLLRSGFTERTM